MRIAVVGLGKIGLPLAVQYASKGHEVVGLDVNAATVSAVSAGEVPFPGEAELDGRLADVVRQGQLTATTSYPEAIHGSDTVVVIVPLLVDDDGAPDFSVLDQASEALGASLEAGTLVVYETTLPVGTTRTRWAPLLEKVSGLVEGIDFHVAFSPERVLTGRVFADLRKYPKLIGGLSRDGTVRTRSFYEAVLDFNKRTDLDRGNGVWDLGSAEAAEMAKLAETTYRDVNIALVNQFARFAQQHKINIYEVIEASNSQPFSQLHQPGVAVGGHCIPVYPRLYLWGDPEASVVRTARDTNSAMPAYAVDLLNIAENGGLVDKTAVVLGVAYRPGVKETACSGAFAVVEALQQHGARVVVHDPLYSADELSTLGWEPYTPGIRVDVALLQTAHDEYLAWGPTQLPDVRTLLDGRHALDPDQWPGVTVVALGVPPVA